MDLGGLNDAIFRCRKAKKTKIFHPSYDIFRVGLDSKSPGSGIQETHLSSHSHFFPTTLLLSSPNFLVSSILFLYTFIFFIDPRRPLFSHSVPFTSLSVKSENNVFISSPDSQCLCLAPRRRHAQDQWIIQGVRPLYKSKQRWDELGPVTLRYIFPVPSTRSPSELWR